VGSTNSGEAWNVFLGYYFWLQSCLDFLIGQVLGTNVDPGAPAQTGGLYNSPFWGNTMIIFTADHGEYGGAHGLHAKGGALYDEVMNIPLYVSFPSSSSGTGRQRSFALSSSNPTGGVPRSFTCSAVDLLPLIYTLALGNESWRCDPTDIINYLSGRESMMDAMMAGSLWARQRRVAGFSAAALNTPSNCPRSTNQPYVLHTNDEYFYYNNYTDSLSRSYPPHAVAFRTVDATASGSGAFSETGPFGGGKLGVYSNWDNNLNPVPGTASSIQQFEFYNYQPSAPKDNPPGGTLTPNLGEIGNDYWTSGQSNGQGWQYLNAFSPSSITGGTYSPSSYQSELTVIYPQITTAYAKAFDAWQLYSFQAGVSPGSPPYGIDCNNTTGPMNLGYYYFAVSNGSVTIAPGGSGMSTITVALGPSSTSYPAQVTLAPFGTLPGGITVADIDGSPPPYSASVPYTATVTIDVASTVAAGTYYVLISAAGTVTGQGTLVQLAVIAVTVS